MDYDTLTGFLIATAILAVTPGPDNIFVLTQSLVHGKREGLVTTAGLMTGCLVHTSLVAFGVSAIIRQSNGLFLALKIFGALYLFYLAFRTYQDGSKLDLKARTIPRRGRMRLFGQGFLMNVLNPKVALFFLSFFPAFLFNDSLTTVVQFYVLGGLFVLVSFIVFATIALLADRISGLLTHGNRTERFLKWMQIAVFLGIGVFILLSDK